MIEPLAASGTIMAVIVIVGVALVIALWLRLRKVLDEGEAVPGGSMGRQMTESLKEQKPEDFS